MYVLMGCINYVLNVSVILNVSQSTVLVLETLIDSSPFCQYDLSQKQLEGVLIITQTTSWCPL